MSRLVGGGGGLNNYWPTLTSLSVRARVYMCISLQVSIVHGGQQTLHEGLDGGSDWNTELNKGFLF